VIAVRLGVRVVGMCNTQLRATLQVVEHSRNLTLHLPADLIRRAKVYAAQNDTSINSLVRELLEQKVSREDRMRLAADRILAVADQGPLTSEDPGGLSREAIYERR
jgi:plasmid stability protein